MKITSIGCFLFLAQMFCHAQKTTLAAKTNDIVITPGVGVGALKLGMSEAAANSVLKGEITWKTYKEEMTTFKSFGAKFAIDSIVQFVIGFDSCASYAADLPNKMPVYSMYFKNHKLNFITVTSYGKPEALAKRVVLTNGIRFYQSMAVCTSKMKTKYIPILYEGYDGIYIYYKEGLEFTFDGKKLTTIGVFPPTANFAQRIKDKSYDLHQEWEDAE